MKNRPYIFFIFSIFVIFVIFRRWIIAPQIIGGDWPYYYPQSLNDFSLFPTIWTAWQGNGFGGIQPFLGLHLFSSVLIVVFVQWLHIPWELVYKIGWFFASISLSCISMYFLLKAIWKPLPIWALTIGALIYSTNTYMLMLVAGGQIGVALAYALTPLVFQSFYIASPWAGLFLGLQLMIDPRLAYVSFIIIGIYVFYLIVLRAIEIKTLVYILFSFVVSLLLNMFWLLPTFLVKDTVIASAGEAFTTISALRFFSFADFSHALTLLQPNWPENIFGKTYFLQPEFLFLPVIAFSSLLFMRKVDASKRRTIIGFAILGLWGVFLAKGTNEPFPWIYIWSFFHIPGFIMFRDSTKFFVIISMVYATLIPIVLCQLKKARWAYIIFVLLWLFLIHPSWRGKLSGTFTIKTIPQTYTDLQKLLAGDKKFSRTLWVPRFQRFGFATIDHPGSEAEPLFHASNSAELLIALSKENTKEKISALGIKYFIVPDDSLGEIFVTDRMYDQQKKDDYNNVLASVAWLENIEEGQLSIYKVNGNTKDFFWLETDDAVTYMRKNQTEYVVRATTTQPTALHFSQTFDPRWRGEANGKLLIGEKDAYGLMSFRLENPGEYALRIYFTPQKFVLIGMWISLLTAGFILVYNKTKL